MGKDNLDFDTTEFLKRFDLYDGKQRVAAMNALAEKRDDLEKQAKELAPKREGTLEREIMGNPIIKLKKDGFEAEVHAGTGQSRNYAVRVHESMIPAVPTGDKQMKPGELTAGRPGTVVGKAGGKYLTRPLMYFMKKYAKDIADKIKAVR